MSGCDYSNMYIGVAGALRRTVIGSKGRSRPYRGCAYLGAYDSVGRAVWRLRADVVGGGEGPSRVEIFGDTSTYKRQSTFGIS